MFGSKRRRRRRLSATPLDEASWGWIDRNVPLVSTMPQRDREELGGIVRVLLAEKRFEGCAGLAMTEEIRLTIAAQAALLLLHRPSDYYPGLRSILVYPAAYVARSRRPGPAGIVTEHDQIRLGESWHRGSIVLSWEDVRKGSGIPHDGRNVVLHEFAHQLDGQATGMDGAPPLPTAARYREWARVLSHEYAELVSSLHAGHRTLLDPYGATSPPEFFATVTEMFFERPVALRRAHAELYRQLASFYLQDPARWAQTGGLEQQPQDRDEQDPGDDHDGQ